MSVSLENDNGRWELPAGDVLVGRHIECQISLDDPRLSRHHAKLIVAQDELRIEDLNSSNGVMVNGERIEAPRALADGDLVLIGPIDFIVRINPNAPCAQHLYVLYEAPSRPDSELEFLPSPDRRRRPTEQIHDEEEEEDTVPTLEALSTAQPDERTEGMLRRNRQDSTDHLRPGQAGTPKTDPLFHKDPFEALGHELGRIRGRRIAAGVLDLLTAHLVGLLLAVPMAALGYGWALSSYGAVLLDGVPALRSGGTAGGIEIALTLLDRVGLAAVPDRCADVASVGGVPLVLLLGGAIAGACAWLVALGLLLVFPSATRGGPFWHRKLGLHIARHLSENPIRLSQSLLRWFLLHLLAPLALPAALLGRRAPHDALSRCQVTRPDAERPKKATRPVAAPAAAV